MMSPRHYPGRSSDRSASSPLSPRMESLAIPSQARRRPPPHHRQSSGGGVSALRLPSLPRFHPANFPSQQSSLAGTPTTGPNSPEPPLSPRAQQRQYSEAQRQLYVSYQRELTAARTGKPVAGPKPASPRLDPAGSPGPVTPLELEGADGYLTAGVATNDPTSHVDMLIREEAKRRGEMSPSRPTSVGGR